MHGCESLTSFWTRAVGKVVSQTNDTVVVQLQDGTEGSYAAGTLVAVPSDMSPVDDLTRWGGLF